MDLNPTAASLLGFLHDGPAAGWDLLRTARLTIGRFWSITSSQVYRELAAMERAGLIEAGAHGPRERRPFTLTGAGRAAFAEWIRRTPGEEQIRSPLLLTIAFGRHVPRELLDEFLREHRTAHVERLAEYEQARAAVGPDAPYVAATLAFGVRYERAVLDWFDELPDLLASASPDDP